ASIRRQAERRSRLADDLYDISRLESRSIVVNVRAIDVALSVELALGSVPESSDVELRIASGLEALADARRLEQVVANLIENALVHGAPPVVVEASSEGQEVVLSVTDHGPGVAH